MLIRLLGEDVTYYKVGMELYYNAGSAVISYLREQGKEVFLDLKLHDIPNTVAKSSAALCRLGAAMFNLHAAGGREMMQAAKAAVDDTAAEMGIKPQKLIAVTVLTSLNEHVWGQLGYKNDITSQAALMAKLAQEAGLDGVVASPLEAANIR